MFRCLALSTLLLILISAPHSHAAVIREDNLNDRIFRPNGGDGEGGIFEQLNQRLRGIDPKAPNRRDGLVEDPLHGGRGTVDARSAFLCPICREPYFKHNDDNFVCVPKDEDGNPIKIAAIKTRAGQCPVCSATFKGAVPSNINDKAGLDRDYCAHSLGKMTVHSNIWICPDCGYAALIDKFDRSWKDEPLSPAVLGLVNNKLRGEMRTRLLKHIGVKTEHAGLPGFRDMEKFSTYIGQEEIKDWLKYDNAIAIYREEKAPHVLLARLYLEAAHACRRELSGEIAVPFLHLTVMEGLSKSIRRMQDSLTGACMQIQRERKLTDVFDPNRPETDPAVLADAAKMIVEYNEKMTPQIPIAGRGPQAPSFNGYTKGDMFVVYIRLAGFQDRLGKMDEAGKALDLAMNYVPVDAHVYGGEQLDEDLAKFIDKQLQRIRDFVDERKKCLGKEREYLARAMWEHFAALHQDEIQLNNPKSWLTSSNKDGVDPGATAYRLGELARRIGEPAAPPLFFQAAKKLIESQSRQLDTEEQKVGAVLATPDYKPQRDRADELRERWQTIREWSTEQLALSKSGGELDANIKLVLDKMLTAGGIDPKSVTAIDDAAVTDAHLMVAKAADLRPGAKPAVAKTSAVDPVVAPPAASGIKTRAALYQLYFEAISKYVKKSGANPPDLVSLVKEKFITSSDSCLDGKGRIVCPETQEQINYSRSFEFGSAVEQILYSSKNPATSPALYANGVVKIPVKLK